MVEKGEFSLAILALTPLFFERYVFTHIQEKSLIYVCCQRLIFPGRIFIHSIHFFIPKDIVL